MIALVRLRTAVLIGIALVALLGASSAVGSHHLPLAAAGSPEPGSSTIVSASGASAHAVAQSVRPAITTCGISPNWVSGSNNFFTDVAVCFGQPGVSGPVAWQTVPTVDTVPQYSNGFYVNISSNVHLLGATICLWATQFPEPNVGAVDSSTNPPSGWQAQDCFAMVVGGTPNQPDLNPDTAYYYVDCYKYFWPGTNLSMDIAATSGFGEVYSTKEVNVTESYPDGYVTYPTWEFYVQAPFASPTFTNDVHLTTSPSTLSLPTYDPNPTQTVQIRLTSFNQTGGPATPIPAAICKYSVLDSNGDNTTYSSNFGPANSTVMQLVNPIQPEPGGTVIWFNVTLELLWQGNSVIDQVQSDFYSFEFSTYGHLPDPNAQVEKNAKISSVPNVITPGVTTFLPTATAVNVSVHEPQENITFGSAEVDFEFRDQGATHIGSVPMAPLSPNTSYVLIPGLPPLASLTFSVVVHDINGTADSSGNYTYAENGTASPAPPAGDGLFYVEAYDVATNHVLNDINFTIANTTWFETTTTNSLGFGALVAGQQGLPVYLSYGTYVLTIHAFGATIQRSVTVSSATPFTVLFYFSSGTISVATSSPPSQLFAAAGFVGLAAAAVTFWPLRQWFAERRAKAEAEQRRVTL